MANKSLQKYFLPVSFLLLFPLLAKMCKHSFARTPSPAQSTIMTDSAQLSQPPASHKFDRGTDAARANNPENLLANEFQHPPASESESGTPIPDHDHNHNQDPDHDRRLSAEIQSLIDEAFPIPSFSSSWSWDDDADADDEDKDDRDGYPEHMDIQPDLPPPVYSVKYMRTTRTSDSPPAQNIVNSSPRKKVLEDRNRKNLRVRGVDAFPVLLRFRRRRNASKDAFDGLHGASVRFRPFAPTTTPTGAHTSADELLDFILIPVWPTMSFAQFWGEIEDGMRRHSSVFSCAETSRVRRKGAGIVDVVYEVYAVYREQRRRWRGLGVFGKWEKRKKEVKTRVLVSEGNWGAVLASLGGRGRGFDGDAGGDGDGYEGRTMAMAMMSGVEVEVEVEFWVEGSAMTGKGNNEGLGLKSRGENGNKNRDKNVVWAALWSSA